MIVLWPRKHPILLASGGIGDRSDDEQTLDQELRESCQRIDAKLSGDVSFGLEQHRLRDCSLKQSAATQRQDETRPARWRTGRRDQAGRIEEDQGLL